MVRRHHPLGSTHAGMMQRCYEEKHQAFKTHGMRGIKVYGDWHKFHAFATWIDENLGPCPEKHTLDRIDVNGDYAPGNVRWADSKTQWENRRCVIADKARREEALAQRRAEIADLLGLPPPCNSESADLPDTSTPTPGEDVSISGRLNHGITA